MFWHWLDVELWGPMWPNMFAPSLVSLLAIGISHVRQMREHRKTREHVTKEGGPGDG